MALQFEWDASKSKANLRKHEISFEEAASVFLDPFSVTMADPDHSLGEDRYVDIGYSDRGRLLVVVYTDRGTAIRVISCRKATPQEREYYGESD